MTKERTVAVIYQDTIDPQKLTSCKIKLKRRLQRAIEDMVEDGFSSFIMLLDEYNPFSKCFIDAIIEERRHSHNIRLTVMLPYEIDGCFDKSPAERLRNYTQYADEIIYNKREYTQGDVTNQVDKLLEKSSALIIYYEKDYSQLSRITHHAQRNRFPIININITVVR